MSKIINSQMKVQRDPSILFTKTDNEVVMMSMENSEYYGLNVVAGHIWELIKNPILVQDIIESLLQEFEIDKSTCEKEVIEFLSDLNEKKILLLHE